MALIFEFPSVQKLCIPVSKIKNINESLVSNINKSEILEKQLNKIIKDVNSSLK